MTAALAAVLEPYRDRAPADRPDGSRRVRVMNMVFSLPHALTQAINTRARTGGEAPRKAGVRSPTERRPRTRPSPQDKDEPTCGLRVQHLSFLST